MPLDVIMPALGMAQDTGRIVAWHKASGDAVAAGDVLFEVETDKATMEVEAQEPGFLTDVAAAAGDDVPVGDVIARIADAPGDSASPSPAPSDNASSPADALPEGNSVIMPTLGMAQDTGQLVAWHKTPGEAVAADDILFEVETDKSTVEVPAGFEGYIAAQLAEAGEDVPVGDTIAVISAAPPDTPVVRRHATHTVDDNTPPAAEDTNSKPSPPPKPEPERRSNAARAELISVSFSFPAGTRAKAFWAPSRSPAPISARARPAMADRFSASRCSTAENAWAAASKSSASRAF